MYWQAIDPDQAPGYQPPPEDWTEEQKRSRYEIDRWMFLGRQRELEALLDLVPGAREAVKAHAKAFATHAYSDGTRAYT
ncbi:MAG: hypothetical protein M3Q19_14550 [Pseudomonadota bacterium]|nr:hypothetical protein [Pseudomonadota bacterium]